MDAAYHAAALGTRAQLHSLMLTEESAPRELLRAVVAQIDGDVDGAVRILKTLLKTVKPSDRPFVADVLAPIFVMRREMNSVNDLIQILRDANWHAAAEAFRAVLLADAGDRQGRFQASSAARELIDASNDDIMRMRVLQRLALAAYYVHDYDEALNSAMSCARLASSMEAWRSAAAAYSIIYTIKLTIMGELQEADRFARLWHEAALRSADESFVQAALVAEFEMAVQSADLKRFEFLSDSIKTRLLPAQYDERFTYMFFYAVAAGWSDLRAMGTMLQVLLDTKNRTRLEKAACHGLIALAHAAHHDDDLAKTSIALANESLGRPRINDRAYEKQIRRFARASIAATWVIIGEPARAARVVATRDARSAESIDTVPIMMAESRWDDFPYGLRGLAKVFRASAVMRYANDTPAGLTRSEFDVLRMLASGLSAGEIATKTDRSIHTIYNHTQAILAKLEVARTTQAVAIARRRGLIR